MIQTRHLLVALLHVGTMLSLASSLHAGASNKSGNPFGNGTFFSNSGTFSAIERSSNGFLGVLQFSTFTTNASTNSLTNSGVATIYADGQQFTGPVFGTIAGSTIAATYVGYFQYGVLVPTINLNTNGSTNSITFSPLTLSNTISGQFSATLQNSYPNQIFSGQGQNTAVIQSLDPQTFIISSSNKIYNATVSGSRISQ